jgi:hypothetical protein
MVVAVAVQQRQETPTGHRRAVMACPLASRGLPCSEVVVVAVVFRAAAARLVEMVVAVAVAALQVLPILVAVVGQRLQGQGVPQVTAVPVLSS